MIDTLILAFVAYLIILIVIGIWSSKFNKTLDDFLIAGRKLGTWPVAISAEASDMSGWLVLGLPGRGFVYGISALWTAIGCAIGTLFGWIGIAGKLRTFTEKLKSLTIPDYLEDRFNDSSHTIRAIATSIIALFMVAYVSAQFVASGKILSETFGWDYYIALIVGVIILTFYTMMGGFFAVAWTDVFQGMLMVAIIVFLPIVGIINLGGLDKIFAKTARANPLALSPTFGYSGLLLILFLSASMSWMFGYAGQPHILTRYMAIKEKRKLRQSALIGTVWVILSLWGAVFIGLIGLAYFAKLPDPEKVMPLLALHLLPRWMAGIVIAAITAAIMSTADSQLLVATSAIVEDVYHKLINKDADHKKLVFLSRVTVSMLSLFAFLLAVQGGVVYFLVAFAWGGLAAAFGPLIILSLWWRRITKQGAIAGMITGTFTVIIWDKCGIASSLPTELIIPGMLPAFFVSLFAIILVSILTQQKEK